MVDKAGEFTATAERATELLRATPTPWGEVHDALVEPLRWLGNLTVSDHGQMPPYLLGQALEAVTALWVALDGHDRTAARLAAERLRQTLADLAYAAAAGPTSDPAALAGQVEQLLPGTSADTLAGLVGTSARTWQRWSSRSSEPRGDQADLLRSLVQTLTHLRYTFTPAGCVAWLGRPHPDLDGQTPAVRLNDPLHRQQVVDVAAGARVSAAT